MQLFSIYNPLPHIAPFNAIANRADPDQAALVKSCLIRVYSVCLWKYEISDPTHVDLTSNFFVLCTKVKVYIYNYSLSMNIHEGKG